MDNNSAFYWVRPERYYGELNGNLYKACIDINYFDENGFVNQDLLTSMALDLNISNEKARNVELVDYAPGNICYDIDYEDDYLKLYFSPIVVRSYYGELYDVVTGLKVVPKEQGPSCDAIAVDRIETLDEDCFDKFMDVMVDADNSFEREVYYDFLSCVHQEQLKTNKKYVRD